MSKRDAVRMTDDEVALFLTTGVRCRIATLDRHGAPRVVPVNYVVLDGRVAFWADPGSQKVINLRRDPRVSCVVDDGEEFDQFQGVELIGTADIRDDETTAAQMIDAMLGTIPPEWHEVARPHLAELATKRVVVAIDADRTISWDHSKVPGLTPEDVGR